MDSTIFTIRPHRFDDDDFRAHLEIHHLLWPEYPFSMGEWRHSIEGSRANSDFFSDWFVVETEQEAVVAIGYLGEPPHAYSAGAYMMDIRVHPDSQRQGIGKVAYEYILATATGRGEPPLRSLLSATRSNRPHSMRFLEQRGFRPVLVTNASELDVTAFDRSAYAPLFAELAEAGIRLVSGAELETEMPDRWRRKLWALHQTLMEDVPAVVPYTPISYEAYEATIIEHPSFYTDACFLALDGDDFVGMSYLRVRSEKPQELETGITGVLRDYRRRGIATALKVMAADFAHRYGAETIMTMNEEKNPMYQLNLQLGFTPLPTWITYKKEFGKLTT
jgi:mycothiol synthase